MSSFAKFQNEYHVTPDRDLYLTTIPPGNYSVNFNEHTGGISFTVGDDFTPPQRVYGKLNEWGDRILRTFQDRPGTTGVLLYGVKGSGKSQLARLISIKAANQGVPTLIINSTLSGATLTKALEAFDQPVVVLIDEFEKLYREAEVQESLLTLMDGTMTGKVLFLLTCNQRRGVSSNMHNRPGRVYYSVEFGGVDEEFVREYATANLTNQAHVEKITKLSTAFTMLTFDMLKAWVEEINRYGEEPVAALELLNISPVESYDHYTYRSPYQYKVSVTDRNGRVYAPPAEPQMLSLDPLSMRNIQVWFEDDPDDSKADVVFTQSDLAEANVARGLYTFRHDGATMHLVREVTSDPTSYEMFSMLNVV